MPRVAVVMTLVVALLATTGCRALDPTEPEPEIIDSPVHDVTPDPASGLVDDAFRLTLEALAAVATELESVAGLDESEARDSAGRAARMLTDDPRVVGGLPGDDPADDPFLPSREDAASTLGRALGIAHEAGDAGTRLVAVFNDPVVGDLTTWQRQPEDRLGEIAAAVRDGSEDAVESLDGQVPRALAWAALAAQGRGTETIRDRAERAAAHLAVAIAALEEVRR